MPMPPHAVRLPFRTVFVWRHRVVANDKHLGLSRLRLHCKGAFWCPNARTRTRRATGVNMHRCGVGAVLDSSQLTQLQLLKTTSVERCKLMHSRTLRLQRIHSCSRVGISKRYAAPDGLAAGIDPKRRDDF